MPAAPAAFLEAVVANRGEPFSYDQLPSLVYALVTWPILSCVVLHLTDAFVARYRRSPRRRERITAEGGTWEYMHALGWKLVESGIEDAPHAQWFIGA